MRGAAVWLGTGHARVFLAVGLFGMKWAGRFRFWKRLWEQIGLGLRLGLGRTKRKLVLGKFLVLGLLGIGLV